MPPGEWLKGEIVAMYDEPLELDNKYRIQFVAEESGTCNHHLVASVETDITILVSLDVTWIWDRIEDPRPDSDGVIPARDGFRTSVGLTFEFQAAGEGRTRVDTALDGGRLKVPARC